MSHAAIVAAPCVVPVGPSLPLADSALNAHLTLRRNHPFYVDRCGTRVKGMFFPDPAVAFDADRWCALARAALDELWRHLEVIPPSHLARPVLWLVFPRDDRPGVPNDLVERLLDATKDVRLPWRRVVAVRGGHAAGAQALAQAIPYGASISAPTLQVVLAVDTWLHPAALGWLEDHQLLHAARTRYRGDVRVNPHGRVPGEGAAAVAIVPKPAGIPVWATIAGCATASEAITFEREEPCVGKGLSDAAVAACAGATDPRVRAGRLWADLNGEPYRADEFGFTSLRLAERLQEGWQRLTPALAFGDLGAAGAIAHTALAAYRLRTSSTAGGAGDLILCSSDDMLRGAIHLLPAPRTASAPFR